MAATGSRGRRGLWTGGISAVVHPAPPSAPLWDLGKKDYTGAVQLIWGQKSRQQARGERGNSPGMLEETALGAICNFWFQ